MIVDEENVIELYVGNYYGSLSITENDGKFFWSVENWDGHHWYEIPKSLFDALKQYAEGKK